MPSFVGPVYIRLNWSLDILVTGTLSFFGCFHVSSDLMNNLLVLSASSSLRKARTSHGSTLVPPVMQYALVSHQPKELHLQLKVRPSTHQIMWNLSAPHEVLSKVSNHAVLFRTKCFHSIQVPSSYGSRAFSRNDELCRAGESSKLLCSTREGTRTEQASAAGSPCKWPIAQHKPRPPRHHRDRGKEAA